MQGELKETGLTLELIPSKDVRNPRASAISTWVGVDVDIPKNHAHSKTGLLTEDCVTMAELADNYFDFIGGNEHDFDWWPVVSYESYDTDDVLSYGCYGVSRHKDANRQKISRGFIYISRTKSLELFAFNLALKKTEIEKDNCISNETRVIFDNELDLYTAWELGDVFDIKIATLDDSLSEVINHVFNVNGDLVQAVKTAEQLIINKVNTVVPLDVYNNSADKKVLVPDQ